MAMATDELGDVQWFYEALCDTGLKPKCDWKILPLLCLESL